MDPILHRRPELPFEDASTEHPRPRADWTTAVIVVAAAAAGAVLASVPFDAIGTDIAERPVLAAVLGVLLLAMAGVSGWAIALATRMGERGDILRLVADDLERRLSEPLSRGQGTNRQDCSPLS